MKSCFEQDKIREYRETNLELEKRFDPSFLPSKNLLIRNWFLELAPNSTHFQFLSILLLFYVKGRELAAAAECDANYLFIVNLL